MIREPKERMISAAPFRDRVVHHGLCGVIEPIFEKSFIVDTYANRTGFGTHRALKRFTTFARSSKYVLQCDIRKYFPSIDHEILKTRLRRKLKCERTLELIDLIIDNSNGQDERNVYFNGDDLFTPFERRRGLPIGNLTSQFFANIYLSGFDHFIKEDLGIKKYIRYVDDFALFSDDKDVLSNARKRIEEYLETLRLEIHPIKSQLFKTENGVDFVGFRVLPEIIRVRSNNLRRARWRFRKIKREFSSGQIGHDKLTERVRSWIAHLEHGDTYRLREKIFSDLKFSRARMEGGHA
jgi:retron-type reverse transcriptase